MCNRQSAKVKGFLSHFLIKKEEIKTNVSLYLLKELAVSLIVFLKKIKECWCLQTAISLLHHSCKQAKGLKKK